MQGATNRVHIVQMFTNNFVVYAKFLEVYKVLYANIKYFYFGPAFFTGWKSFCFIYLNLLI